MMEASFMRFSAATPLVADFPVDTDEAGEALFLVGDSISEDVFFNFF